MKRKSKEKLLILQTTLSQSFKEKTLANEIKKKT